MVPETVVRSLQTLHYSLNVPPLCVFRVLRYGGSAFLPTDIILIVLAQFFLLLNISMQITYSKPLLTVLLPAITDCFGSVVFMITEIKRIPSVLIQGLFHDIFKLW